MATLGPNRRTARDLARFAASLFRRWLHGMGRLAQFDLKHREVDIWLTNGNRIVACECGRVFFGSADDLPARD